MSRTHLYNHSQSFPLIVLLFLLAGLLVCFRKGQNLPISLKNKTFTSAKVCLEMSKMPVV